MAIALEESTMDQSATGQESCTTEFALQKASGNNRLVVVLVGWEDLNVGADMIGITFDGDAMTQVSTATVGDPTVATVFMYYMLDADLPAGSGNYDVVATVDETIAREIWQCIIEYSGVKQEAPDDSDIDTTAAEGDVDITLTVDENDSVAIGGVAGGGDSIGATDNLTSLHTNDLDSSFAGVGHNLNADTVSIAIGWDTIAVRGAFVGAVWAPVAAGGVAPTGVLRGPLGGPLFGPIM